jgi:hypothetical protein
MGAGVQRPPSRSRPAMRHRPPGQQPTMISARRSGPPGSSTGTVLSRSRRGSSRLPSIPS